MLSHPRRGRILPVPLTNEIIYSFQSTGDHRRSESIDGGYLDNGRPEALKVLTQSTQRYSALPKGMSPFKARSARDEHPWES